MTLKSLPLVCCLLAIACGGPARPLTVQPVDDATKIMGATVRPGDHAAPDGQLAKDVVPVLYKVALTVDPEQERFSGVAEIEVEFKTAKQGFYLHAKEMKISKVSLKDGTPLKVNVTSEDTVHVAHATSFAAGKSTVVFEYDAPFNTALTGLYRVKSGDDYYAFTQFESTSARLCFPSFDEPAFKVPYEFSLTVKKDVVAAFNTPEVESTVSGDMKTVRFARTKPMPTYLVAMAVGPMDIVEGEAIPKTELRAEPVPFRGLAAKGKGEDLAYAMKESGKLLIALEKYFGTAYPYKKLDIVAVPDFASGAMENVGLVTFRETLLLLKKDAPESQKRWYAYVMAHELAHQWFGNLVTMPWWDDIWLNEAFATWMGYKIVDEVYPKYHGDVQLLSAVQGAMNLDSLVSARQIRQPIESNHDIRNAFDSITYRKGGGVLAMFERWLGEETFREGIRHYMKKHAWGTATYDDLLSALSEKAGKDVATPFKTFLFQAGLPLLKADVVCGEGKPKLSFTQSRYLPAGSTGKTDRSWQIPVCTRFGKGRKSGESCGLLSKPEGEVELDLPAGSCPDWVMPNANAAGYYRFALSADWTKKLASKGYKKLETTEKMAFGDSLKAAFSQGTTSSEELFTAYKAFASDKDRTVATMPMGQISFAKRFLVSEEHHANVKKYASTLYSKRGRTLGFTPKRNEDGEQALLRGSVIGHLAFAAEDKGVRKELVKRAHKYLGFGKDDVVNPKAIDPNLVGVALTVAVQDGDAAFFDYLEKRFFASEDALFRGHALYSLSSTKDPELSKRARALALDSRVRVNEIRSTIGPQFNHKETLDDTWKWMATNFDALAARAENGTSFAPYYVINSYCSEADAVKVQSFFEPKMKAFPGGPRNLQTVVEAINLCAARVEAQSESANAFFK